MWPWSTQACVPTKPKKSLICFQSPPPSNKCLQGIPNAWRITETSLLPPKPSKPSSAPPSSLLNATLHRKKTECEEYKETRMEGEDEEIKVGNKDGGQVVREMINSSTVLKAVQWMLCECSPYIHLKPYWVILLLHTGCISISLWRAHRRRWGSQPAVLVSFKASAVWVRKEGEL